MKVAKYASLSIIDMRNKWTNIKIVELLAFSVIWLSIFSIPYFNNRIFSIVNWDKVIGEWIRVATFLAIFLINIFVLIPHLLINKKYWLYIFAAICVVLFALGINTAIGLHIAQNHPVYMPPMDFVPGMPPMELGSGMAPPMVFKPMAPLDKPSLLMIFIDNMIISFLVIGASTTIKIGAKWLDEEGRRKDIEKEQLRTELAFLRHQVSPHFFMNTLNNIHALVDINAEDAKSTIIQLSTMMRYLLYETQQGHTTLRKELDFIESYIALMKLRFPKCVSVTVSLPESSPEVQIPPMLFTSILENAFKHGVSYKTQSFVAVKIEILDNRLICNIKNSIHKNIEQKNELHSGIGLANVRKSLDLLYDKSYNLEIRQTEKEFEIELSIPII